MKLVADTNVLVRAVMGDDPEQSPIAAKVLTEAELIAVATPSLCELVWVLKRLYELPVTDIARVIRTLVAAANVEVNQLAVDAGLAVLEAGGDFADGVIAFEGSCNTVVAQAGWLFD
jgi:predicted nucleic-acid-binding protein